MIKEQASIAPLVLLSVVDHYKRVSGPRVVGVLLGNVTDSRVSITNSFAIPFEENEDHFFIDSSYLLNMYELFYKVNGSEKIVGWYHSGPKMHSNDLMISRSFWKYCPLPVLAIVDVKMESSDIPVQVYRLGTHSLTNIDVLVGADETEEVGIEHLLRDIKEGTGSTLKDRVEEIKNSLKMYRDCLGNIISYITGIQEGSQENSFTMLENFQEILNEMPRLINGPDLSKIYSSELINTFVSLKDLHRNELENKK